MLEDNFETSITPGDLMKVTHADYENEKAHVRLSDGRAAIISNLGETLPIEGRTIFVSSNGWEYAPDKIWPQKNSIAIIRKIIDDKSVLLDDGLVIKPALNPLNLELKENNTVEFNDPDGIIRLISDAPIRSRIFNVESEDVLNDYLIKSTDDGPCFNDFGGYPDVISRARELIETQLERRDALDRIGARPVKGILFTGPPGTGKTHLARIIANETKADFFLVSGPSIVTKWVGDTEATLRKIFEAAASKESGRGIIFFDEIDSIAERRTSSSHEFSKRLVTQLLTLMDGFDEKHSNVIVIAATNRVETLDPALTRPGRFDWEIEFGIPTASDRAEILAVHAGKLRTTPELPITELASYTEGWSAAELGAIWTEAALLAAGDDRGIIAPEDIAQSYERVADRVKLRMAERQKE